MAEVIRVANYDTPEPHCGMCVEALKHIEELPRISCGICSGPITFRMYMTSGRITATCASCVKRALGNARRIKNETASQAAN